jgi:hypothetical protein
VPPPVASITEENTSIVAFFLTNLARLAFDALPGVGAHKIGNGAKIHASWMATTATLVTRDHFLRFANLILLVVPATETTIWLPAYLPFLFLWLGGEYGLTDRGKVFWWWWLSKGITLGPLRVLANMVESISGKRQRKDGLIWV